jgi:hypothetical protein
MMSKTLMTLNDMARYIGVSPAKLARVLCNRGALEGIPLPEAAEALPLSQRRWIRGDVRQFKHALQRAQAKSQQPQG